jgi:pseudouridine-5'-monophosphatase
MAPFEAE